MNSEIERLQQLIEVEKRRIENCRHEFENSYYNPVDTVKFSGHLERPGAFGNLVTVKEERWSRRCKLCDKLEHTNKLKPIISSYEPDFE